MFDDGTADNWRLVEYKLLEVNNLDPKHAQFIQMKVRQGANWVSVYHREGWITLGAECPNSQYMTTRGFIVAPINSELPVTQNRRFLGVVSWMTEMYHVYVTW